MTIKADHWIARMAREHRMIEPFEPQQVRFGPSGARVISYGLSSYGYDIRVADEFKIFTPNPYNTVVDPKAIDERVFQDFKGDVCIIPPNSYALCRSLEYFRIPSDVLVIVLGKCLTGDTRVVDAASGACRPIREFVGIGKTLALAGDGLRVFAASDVIPRGKQPVFRLSTRSGRQIRATSTHPFLTVGGWMALAELKIGTRVAVARRIPIFGSRPIPEWEAILLGLMIPEGQCSTPDRSPTFTSSDPVLVDLFASCVREGLECEVAPCGEYGYSIVSPAGRGGEMALNRGGAWLGGHGLGAEAGETSVPRAIFQAPRQSVALFLRAVFTAGGTIYLHRQRRNLRLAYRSTSRRLVDDLHHLLLRFGIFSRIRAHPRRGQAAYELRIHNKADLATFLAEIGFWPGSIKQAASEAFAGEILSAWNSRRSKADDLPPEARALARTAAGERSFNSIGIVGGVTSGDTASTPARAILEATQDGVLSPIAGDDIFWDSVVSIEPAGEEEVFDISVPGAHNFLANDIVVHNSTYARSGIIVNVTPGEPGWEGHWTIEISNASPLPAKIYANEGIAQCVFFQSDALPQISYADRAGKYQGQTGITLPRI